ncbi:MAG: thioredoxin-like domain-containing protein [Planctomycetota bacterium]
MIRPTLFLLALACAGASAQDAWRERVDALLDRWADDAGERRLERAHEVLVSHLVRVPDDPEARLELSRLELAQDNYRAAITAADLALERIQATERGANLQGQALAVSLLAARYLVHEQLDGLEAEGEDAQRYLEQQTAALDGRRQALARVLEGEEAATEALARELRRRQTLQTLDLLGGVPRPLGTDDTDGKPIDLTRYRGQVTLIVFWSTTPVDCKPQLERIEAVREAHAEAGFSVIGINLDPERETMDQTVSALGLEWRHVYGGQGLTSTDAQAWGVKQVPSGVLLDTSGRIRYVNPWGPDLEAKVADLLARRPGR